MVAGVGIEDAEESRDSLLVDGVEFVVVWWSLPAAAVVSTGSAVSCDVPDMELKGRSEDDIMTLGLGLDW